MKLFYNPASPFVRKVLITAIECGLEDRVQKHPLALTPVNANDDLNTQNPLGKIPALVLDDGSTLYDSRVICEYLNSLAGGKGSATLFPEGEDRWKALRLSACGDGICDAAVTVRYETFVRPEQYRWGDWIEGQKNKFRRAVAVLENEVAGFENTLDIGTISIAVALDYIDFRYADEAWRDSAGALAEWHKRFVQRPSFQQTAPHDLKS